MSDSEDTVRLLGSKISDFNKASALNPNHVIPEKEFCNTKDNSFVLNGRKHVLEIFTPVQSVLVIIVSILTGLCYGFDMTTGSNVLVSLGSVLDLNCFEHRMLINGWIVGAVFGSILGGIIVDKFGRRCAMLSSSLIFSACSLLGVTSGLYLIPFIPRFLSGCSVSSLIISQCVYITEISTNSNRYRTAISQQNGIQIGIFLSAIIGLGNATNPNNQIFHVITGVICVFGIFIFFVTYAFFPESTHFVLAKEKKTKIGETHYGIYDHLDVKSVAWPLMLIVVLLILSQLCIRPWVLYYAPRIFTLLGICMTFADSAAGMTMSSIRVLTTLFLFYTNLRQGIRMSMVFSYFVMGLSLIVLSLSIATDLPSDLEKVTPGSGNRVCNVLPVYSSIGMLPLPGKKELMFSDFTVIKGDTEMPPFPLLPTPVALHSENYVMDDIEINCSTDSLMSESLITSQTMSSFIALLTYEVGYTIGSGTFAWLFACEILPTKWRATGLGVTIGFQLIFDLFVQMQIFTDSFPVYVYTIFGVICLLSIIVWYKIIPMTKNSSLTDIQSMMKERYASCWMCCKGCSCSRESPSTAEFAHI